MFLFYAFIVEIVFAISDSLWKIPLRYTQPAVCIFFRNIITSIFLGTLAWWQGDWANYEWNVVTQAIGIAAISFWGLYFFVKSQQFIPLSIVSTLGALSAIIKFSIGILFFQEEITIQKIVIFSIVLLSVFLMNWQPQTGLRFNQGFLWIVLAALFWGISGAFTRPIVLQIGAAGFGFILELTILCMSLLLHFKSIPTLPQVRFTKVLPTVFLIALLGSTGVYFDNLGYKELPISIWVIVGICRSFIPIAISYFLYKEPLQKRQWVGVGLCIGVSLFITLQKF